MHQPKALRARAILATLALPGFLAAAEQQPAPSFGVTQTVSLGAPDRWDYVVYDETTHDVFVAHGDRVTVVDGRDGRIVGNIEGMPGGTHGIAISASTGLGYTDDGERMLVDLNVAAHHAAIALKVALPICV